MSYVVCKSNRVVKKVAKKSKTEETKTKKIKSKTEKASASDEKDRLKSLDEKLAEICSSILECTVACVTWRLTEIVENY